MARSGAIHRNHIKAASRKATMNPPINAWSCVRRSRNHCNLSGILSPQWSEHYEECIGATGCEESCFVVMLFMDTAVYLFDDWFDPIEAVVRDRVRGPAACRSHPWAAIGPGGSSCR